MNENGVNLEKDEMNQALPVMNDEIGVPLGFVASLKAIVVNPREAFESLRQKPRILGPLVLIACVLAFGAILTFDQLMDYTREVMRFQMQQQGQSMEGMADMMGTIEKWAAIGTIGGMLVGVPLTMLIKGSVVHVIMMLFNGKGTWKQSVAAVTNAYLVLILGSAIKTPMVMLTGNAGITFSPAIFLAQEQAGSPLFNLLAQFDVFALWYLGLSIYGIAILHKAAKWKASIAVLVPFLIIVGMSLVSMLIQSTMG